MSCVVEFSGDSNEQTKFISKQIKLNQFVDITYPNNFIDTYLFNCFVLLTRKF